MAYNPDGPMPVAYNPSGPMPVSNISGPRPTPPPIKPRPTPPINTLPKPGNSGPAKQSPGNKGTGKGPSPYIIPNAPATKPTGKPVPIPNATRHTGPYVTPKGAQLVYSSSLSAPGHPNDRRGSRGYGSNIFGSNTHLGYATPPQFRGNMPFDFNNMAKGHVPLFPNVPGAKWAQKNIPPFFPPINAPVTSIIKNTKR